MDEKVINIKVSSINETIEAVKKYNFWYGNREYSPLEMIVDNYENFVVSLDDISFPSHNG